MDLAPDPGKTHPDPQAWPRIDLLAGFDVDALLLGGGPALEQLVVRPGEVEGQILLHPGQKAELSSGIKLS